MKTAAVMIKRVIQKNLVAILIIIIIILIKIKMRKNITMKIIQN